MAHGGGSRTQCAVGRHGRDRAHSESAAHHHLAGSAGRRRSGAHRDRWNAGGHWRRFVPHRRPFDGVGARRRSRARTRIDPPWAVRADPGPCAAWAELRGQGRADLLAGEQGYSHHPSARGDPELRRGPPARHVRRRRYRDRFGDAGGRGCRGRSYRDGNPPDRDHRQGRGALRAARGEGRRPRPGLCRDPEGVAEGDRVVVAANFLIDAESNLKAALQRADVRGRRQK